MAAVAPQQTLPGMTNYVQSSPPYQSLPMAQQQPAVVYQQPTMAPVTLIGGSAPVLVGKTPTHVTCPQCCTHVMSEVSYENGYCVWMSAFMLCIFGLIPCMFIPFCMKSMKDVHHYCPKCKAFLGVYSMMVAGGQRRYY